MTTLHDHAMKLLSVATDVQEHGDDANAAHEMILQASFLLQRQAWRDGVDSILRELPYFDHEPTTGLHAYRMMGTQITVPIGSWYYEQRNNEPTGTTSVNLIIGVQGEQHAGEILKKLAAAGHVEGWDHGLHDTYVGATDIVTPYGWLGFRLKAAAPIGG